jgi:hypothetical protein
MNVIILCLALVWLSSSALINFVVVPAVFSVIKDFFQAGFLGIELFSKFNRLELLFATGLLTATITEAKINKKKLWKVSLAGILLVLVCFYLFYLTPKLTALTTTWEYAQTMGTIAEAEADIQSMHMMYHRTYIILDSVKLLLITLLLSLEALSLYRQKG